MHTIKPSQFIIVDFLLMFLMLACKNPSSTTQWDLSSPDGNIRLDIKLAAIDDLGYPADKVRLYYRVKFGKKIILPFSPLGIRRQDQDFIDCLLFVSRSEVSEIDESYRMLHGKRKQCRNHAHQLTLNFRNQQAAGLQLIFRAYNDGIAFRYRFPQKNDSIITVTRELSGFRVPEGTTAFIAPHEDASLYEPSYESYFKNGIPAGTESPTKAGWHFPALFKIEGGKYWALLTEAGLDDSYCGSHLDGNSSHNIYRIRFPEADEGNGTGDVCPKWTLPWATPWRAIIVGNSLATIVESSLVTNLSPPSVVKDTSWIKPGRVSWSWWSDNDSPMNRKKLEHFIDLAAEMGWEYSLVDANWNEMPEGSIEKLVGYAGSKNVSLILWYNSGGPHNNVMIFPRDRMDDRARRRKEFKWLHQIGVSGVKVDFWQSDKQNIIRLYLDVLRDAADFHLMVNFHGCTIPRGWTRTFPHLMSMEGVRGAENYLFGKTYFKAAPWHNTILPFTRNVIGPMDYTPVTFSDTQFPHETTYAHELALSVVYESGWIHFADKVSAYENLPDAPKHFLRTVPAEWDDIHFIAGEPGKLAVIARRKGNEWFVGGISGEDVPEKIPIHLSFLAGGDYSMTFISDGKDAKSFKIVVQNVSSDETVNVTMLPRGGFVMRLAPENEK